MQCLALDDCGVVQDQAPVNAVLDDLNLAIISNGVSKPLPECSEIGGSEPGSKLSCYGIDG